MSDRSQVFTAVETTREGMKATWVAIKKANSTLSDQDVAALTLLATLKKSGIKIPDDYAGTVGSAAYVAANASQLRQAAQGKDGQKSAITKLVIDLGKMA